MRPIGVDVGGTFTDLVYADTEAGQTGVHKISTTPDDPSRGVVAGLTALCDKYKIPRETIDSEGHTTEVITKGRHDPCVGIRATPIAEALLALVVMDHVLMHRAQCGDVVHPLPPIAAQREG